MESEDENIFQQMVKDAFPDQVISHFVLIAEVVDGRSERLSLFMSDGMTPWLARGMMQSATDMISDAEYSFREDEDD